MKQVILLYLILIGSLSNAEFVNEDLTSFRSFRFTMVNDNPFLNLYTPIATENDAGYTHGISLLSTWVNQAGIISSNERWKVALQTDLYTKNLTPPGENLFPNVPQKFNEVTSFKVTWDNMYNEIDEDQLYYVVGAGIGLMNDKKDKNWMAIGQQTAWHHYKHYNLTPESTPLYVNELGNTYDNFLIVDAAVGRVVSFNESMRNCKCEINYIKAESGVEYISIRKGSFVYLLMAIDKSLFHWGKTDFGMEGNIESKKYQTGDFETTTHVGVRVKRPSLTINSGMTYIHGNQNDEFYKYVDKDPIWSLFVEYRWGGVKK